MTDDNFQFWINGPKNSSNKNAERTFPEDVQALLHLLLLGFIRSGRDDVGLQILDLSLEMELLLGQALKGTRLVSRGQRSR